MEELNELRRLLGDFKERIHSLRGTFDYEQGKERLEEVLLQLENPSIWNDPAEAQKLGEERARLEKTVGTSMN